MKFTSRSSAPGSGHHHRGRPVRQLRTKRNNLRLSHPFERALDYSNTYYYWMIDRIYMVVPAC